MLGEKVKITLEIGGEQMAFDPISTIIAVASAAYQLTTSRRKQRRQKEEAERQRELSLGQQINVEGSAEPIGVHYGLTLISGIRVFADTSRNPLLYPSDDAMLFPTEDGFQDVIGFRGFTYEFNRFVKNEVLLTQTVIGLGTIEQVVAININDEDIESDLFDDSIYVEVHQDFSRTAGASSGIRVPTDVFTGMSVATALYRLNRENPQFNGVPNTSFFLAGNRIRVFTDPTTSSVVYSNNVIWVLYDYLTNDLYGMGVPASKIDINSFIAASRIAAEVVESPINPSGRVNVGFSVTRITRYEFNGSLSTDNSHPENIDKILSVIIGASFFRALDGTYKIKVPPSTGTIEQASVFNVTADHLIGSISINYPDTEQRLNHFVLRYRNSESDFVVDTMSVTDDLNSGSIYNDNDIRLEGGEQIDGINNRYMAYNIAHQKIKQSRLRTFTFRLTKIALQFEPGDIINITDTLTNINHYLTIDSITGTPEFTFNITAIEADINTYAWISPESIPVIANDPIDFTIVPPINLSLVYNTMGNFVLLEWDRNSEETIAVSSYLIEFKTADEDDYTTLGTSITTEFRHFIAQRDSYDYRVYAITGDGRRSEPSTVASITATDFVVSQPFIRNVTQEEYQPQGNLSVKTRLVVTWSESIGQGVSYELGWKLSDETEYETSGLVVERRFVIPEIVDGTYDLRVRAVSGDTRTEYSDFRYTVSAVLNPPADIMNLTLEIVEGVAFLKWDLPAELGVINGGHIEIRHSVNTGLVNWDDALTVVESVQGRTTTQAVAYSAGTYLVKAFNQFGIESVDPARVSAGEVDLRSLTLAREVIEDPSFAGTASNFERLNSPVDSIRIRRNSVTGEFITIRANYQFDNILDLGSVRQARIIADVNVTAADFGSTIDDRETLIDTWTDFDGGTVRGVSSFLQARWTDDDPTSASPTWTPFQTITILDNTARAYQFVLSINNTYSNIGVTVDRLRVGAYLPTRSVIGEITTLSTTATRVIFDPVFFNTPSASLTILSPSTGDYVEVVRLRGRDITFSVRDSAGNRIAKTVNYLITGV